MEKRDSETWRAGEKKREKKSVARKREDQIQISPPRCIKANSPYHGSEMYSHPHPIYFGVAGENSSIVGVIGSSR